MSDSVTLHHGDCLEVLRTLPDESIDSMVTDPPAGISFMGKGWDGDKGGRDEWVAWLREVMLECHRVLKPGAHALVWALPRTSHWTATGIEDAGFEIRDVVVHLQGQGFPKSLNVKRNLIKQGACCVCGEIEGLRNLRHGVRPEGRAWLLAGETMQQGLLRDMATDDSIATHAGDSATRQGWLDGGEPGVVPVEHVRGSESRMEGRRDASAAAGWLRDGEIRALPEGVASDGEVGRLRDGAPRGHGDAGAPDSHPGGSGASRESRSSGQSRREPGTVAGQSLAQDGGAWPHCGGCRKPVVPDGFGTALKPAAEHWILARKPLDGTVAANVLAHGTGALNIDGCRIGTELRVNQPAGNKPGGASFNMSVLGMPQDAAPTGCIGRWPANVTLDEEAAAMLDEQSGVTVGSGLLTRNSETNRTAVSTRALNVKQPNRTENVCNYGDSGGASRFFFVAGKGERFKYVAKPSRRERGEGNTHPTVKSLALMRWLCRLITPPGGVVLDPFAGSGSTLCAAMQEGFRAVGIEREAEYVAIIRQRVAAHAPPPTSSMLRDDRKGGEE